MVAGGVLSAELVEHLFLPAFGAAASGATPTDAARLDIGGARLAFSTDAFVVDPLFFPGGNIGDLAINGTVNDVAMSGAVPIALSTAFVLEEGLELSVLGTIAESMGRAATAAGVQLVTGDTKVTDVGDGTGLATDEVSQLHCLRDATRGGMAASLCELAVTAGVGMSYRERSLPIATAVASACSFLGLDPIHVANEGKLVAFVAPEAADAVLQAMQGHERGPEAVIIGEVVDDHHGMVVARTSLGATRVVDMPLGEQLPRIC